MPKITGCTSDGIDAVCTDCPFKLDLEGCRLYHQVYGAEDIWSDD